MSRNNKIGNLNIDKNNLRERWYLWNLLKISLQFLS